MRDESARPSGSRTVGQAMTRVGQRQVAGHAPDDHDLLGILLAEVGALGADEREEDGHHRGDPVEVPRSSGALERCGHGADADERVEARRIDLLDVRQPDDVHALGLADGQVGASCPAGSGV